MPPKFPVGRKVKNSLWLVLIKIVFDVLFAGKDELTVLHASQCTPLTSCSAVMEKGQDKGWVTTIFEWLRR